MAMNDHSDNVSFSSAQPQAFQADVARLLHLMVHSVYSERDIFLRELISNAADACEKLRYEALARPELAAQEQPFAIDVTIDSENKTLIVSDNGIGMDQADLVNALGTIASSGTRAFLERMGANRKSESDGTEQEGGNGAKAGDLIGQFGIGFYSAFMVADRVVVETRRAGTDQAFAWESDGQGTYTITPLATTAFAGAGTRVVLHLAERAHDLLESWKVEQIIREHSGAIAVPVRLRDNLTDEPRVVADGAALWARPKQAISEQEYKEFYHSLAGQFDDPALTLHWRAEGRHEYTVLAFVPGSRPFDLFDPARKGRAKLYVRRVLISAEADLVPGWLRFMRLVVDSADLPLNVSREMIQQSPVLAAIKKGITGRVLQELARLAAHDGEAYGKFWDHFGAVLKEGLYEDPERRDPLFELCRFVTSTHPGGGRTLKDYVANLRPNQTAIYYLVGDDARTLATSPQIEGFRARGIEVLLLADPVDAFWVNTATGFDGKPFKSVTQGNVDLKSVPMADGAAEPDDSVDADVSSLLAFFKQTLADKVEDVRASDRLAESPACLVAPESGLDRRLEQILAQAGKAHRAKPVLEINPGHALVASLAHRLQQGASEQPLVQDAAWLLYEDARLADGEKPEDAAAFGLRLRRVLARAITP
jgi:molecular chaperone HtpG